MITLVYIHGINVSGPGYSNPLHTLITDYLADNNFWDEVIPVEVYWAKEFGPAIQRLQSLAEHERLWWKGLRHFTLETVAQTLGYEDEAGLGTYERVHRCLSDVLARVPKESKVFVVAHSLGSIVISNYVWDTQHQRGVFRPTAAWTPSQRLTNLAGVVTMGSPLALYNSRFSNFGCPITMASAGRSWWNVIERADLLAWPLQGLNPDYDAEVTKDAVVKPRWWDIKRWTPWAHLGYWTSPRVAATIGNMILSVARPK